MGTEQSWKRGPVQYSLIQEQRGMLRLTALVIVMTAVSGCSLQQVYSSAQGWQRNQCNRLVDQTERERCVANASLSYDDYQRKTEGAKKE